jgi:membrane associated rhomboid family serine protease
LPKIEFNAPVTVCYALGAVAATLFPVQNMLAIHGPIRPLDTGFILSLLGWTMAHGGMTHLLSNFVVILLTGPLLEDRYGSFRMLGVLVAASVAVGLAQCILDPEGALIGASGTVFCLIMMTAMMASRSGAVPLTVVLVAVLYLGREVLGLLEDDGISQTAHILGGVLGVALGLVMRAGSAGGSGGLYAAQDPVSRPRSATKWRR